MRQGAVSFVLLCNQWELFRPHVLTISISFRLANCTSIYMLRPGRFSSPSHEMGDPAIISRLLPDTRAAEQASELPVLLYCRPGKKLPYVFCGQLGNGEVLKDENNREEAGVAADLLAQEEKREKCTRPGNRCIAWTLLDFEELMATSPHFRNMLEFSSVEI